MSLKIDKKSYVFRQAITEFVLCSAAIPLHKKSEPGEMIIYKKVSAIRYIYSLAILKTYAKHGYDTSIKKKVPFVWPPKKVTTIEEDNYSLTMKENVDPTRTSLILL